jgi:hypothetical protein
MHLEPSHIYIPFHAISNDRWHAMWFLTIENLCHLKDEAPKYGQEAMDLRSKKLQLDPKFK